VDRPRPRKARKGVVHPAPRRWPGVGTHEDAVTGGRTSMAVFKFRVIVWKSNREKD
jgi:hypothetical protein